MKKLFMPLALIFFALFLGVGRAKAQTNIPVNLYTYADNENWHIVLQSATDIYDFNTYDNYSHWKIEDQGYVTIGSVPPGTYTISFYNDSESPYTYEDIYVNGIENDHSLTSTSNWYTFNTTITINSTDEECSIIGNLDSDE